MGALLSAGVWATIGGFFKCLPELLFCWWTSLFLVPLYLIFMGISTVSLFAETAFKKLAGIDTIYLNGNAYGGGSGTTNNGQDLVYAFKDLAQKNEQFKRF